MASNGRAGSIPAPSTSNRVRFKANSFFVLVRVTQSISGGVAELSARCYKSRRIALAIISIVRIGEIVNKFSFRLSTQYLHLRCSPPLLFLLALLKPAETVRFPRAMKILFAGTCDWATVQNLAVLPVGGVSGFERQVRASIVEQRECNINSLLALNCP